MKIKKLNIHDIIDILNLPFNFNFFNELIAERIENKDDLFSILDKIKQRSEFTIDLNKNSIYLLNNTVISSIEICKYLDYDAKIMFGKKNLEIIKNKNKKIIRKYTQKYGGLFDCTLKVRTPIFKKK
jgi:hypothetical protein